MDKDFYIGHLIKDLYRKSGMSPKDFADKIGCSEKNIYKFFNSRSINTATLATIGKALGHNFFVDISNSIKLSGCDDPIVIKEQNEKAAVTQFVDVVPKVLYNLGIDADISFGKPLDYESDYPIPDYMIRPYPISFSLDKLLIEKYEEKCSIEDLSKIFCVRRFTSKDGRFKFDLWDFINNTPSMVNVVLDYKTEKEWEDLFKFVLGSIYEDLQNPKIERLELDRSQIKMITKHSSIY